MKFKTTEHNYSCNILEIKTFIGVFLFIDNYKLSGKTGSVVRSVAE